MSLKAFHVVFVLVSTALSLSFGAWCIHAYRTIGGLSNLWMGIGSLLVSVVLMWYFKWFLKKLKNVSYL